MSHPGKAHDSAVGEKILEPGKKDRVIKKEGDGCQDNEEKIKEEKVGTV